ncbi:MAG: nitronate monooxygenase [Bacteroidales bacterium]
MRNRITQLFGIRYPIIQGGMVWCSGWRLASAVSNAGGLGLIGSGSMHPDVLREHIRKCREATKKPFGVNIPLLYPRIDDIVKVVAEEKVPIVFTSAGSPAKYTGWFKEHGILVAHVVANVRFALKSQESGVDAIVAEGFEAGGHNGREETTTMTLIPLIRQNTSLPLIAAGGIASGGSMLAAFALGAEGVQIGTRFAVSEESSAHLAFKEHVIKSGDGDTMLSLKKIGPVRMMKNRFWEQVSELEETGASSDQLAGILGKGRAKLGIFEGDLDEGELEIGQVAALVRDIQPVSSIMDEIIREYNQTAGYLSNLKL